MLTTELPFRSHVARALRSAHAAWAAVLLLTGWASCCHAQQPSEPWSQLAPFFTPPADIDEPDPRYSSPLEFYDGRWVESADQWPQRRAEILAAWHKLMGPWPPLLSTPAVTLLEREHRDNFTQQRVRVQIAAGDETTDGYLLIPDGEGPFPAVLVTFYDGRTSVGLGENGRGQGSFDFGYQLARRGFVTLSIGTPGSTDPYGKDTREALVRAGQKHGIQPLTLLAYAAANCHTALAQMPQVDPQRIGIVGLSYGGKWAMLASCLYDKFACAVWSDPGIVFDESNRNINYYEPWYLGYDFTQTRQRPAGVPSDDKPRTGLYKYLVDAGRDLNELHPLMTPRPFLVSGGTEDGPERWGVLKHVVEVNRLLGFNERVGMTSRKTHVPTPEAAEQTCLFFEHFLKGARN